MSDIELFEIKLNHTEKGYFNLQGYCSVPDPELCREKCIYSKKDGGDIEICPYFDFRINAVARKER